MSIRYSDALIAALIAEPKTLAANYKTKFELKQKRGHKEQELEITGEGGGRFVVILRQSNRNPLDFSAILAYMAPESTQPFRLRRYNGKSHQHTNVIQRETFYDFHIHHATEAYQGIGAREDAYARPTSEYSDYDGAIRLMLKECGFRLAEEPQQRLFDEGDLW